MLQTFPPRDFYRPMNFRDVSTSRIYMETYCSKRGFFLRGRATSFNSPASLIIQRYSGTSQISVSSLSRCVPSPFRRLVFGQSRKKILDKKWLGVLSSTAKYLVPGASPVFHPPASCTDGQNFGVPTRLVTRFDVAAPCFIGKGLVFSRHGRAGDEERCNPKLSSAEHLSRVHCIQ